MTTVENVVRLAAKLVGIQEKVDGHFNGTITAETKLLIEGLVCCFNTVENELAVDYVPIVCEETVTADDGGIEYASLSRPAAHVIAVFDDKGKEVEVRKLSSRLGLAAGTYTIRYAALPAKKDVEDSSDYDVEVFERLLAYGVAAEYCLHRGFYEEHVVWEKKYRLAIDAALKIQEESKKHGEALRMAALEAEKAAAEAEKASEEAKRLGDYKTIKARDWI